MFNYLYMPPGFTHIAHSAYSAICASFLHLSIITSDWILFKLDKLGQSLLLWIPNCSLMNTTDTSVITVSWVTFIYTSYSNGGLIEYRHLLLLQHYPIAGHYGGFQKYHERGEGVFFSFPTNPSYISNDRWWTSGCELGFSFPISLHIAGRILLHINHPISLPN